MLLDQHDAAAALLRVVAHDREQPLDDHRRQAEAELVEQQQLRPPGERPPDGEHLLLAAGEQAAAPVAQLGQRREVAVGGVGVQPLAAVAEAEVLGHGEPEEQAAVSRDVRDAEPCPRARLDRGSGRRPRSGCCPAIGWTRPETARSVVVFPAPLAPSSATTSPGCDDEVEAAHHCGAVVSGGQAVDLEHGRAHVVPACVGLCRRWPRPARAAAAPPR